jgi:hypothetical protein
MPDQFVKGFVFALDDSARAVSKIDAGIRASVNLYSPSEASGAGVVARRDRKPTSADLYPTVSHLDMSISTS